MDKIHPKSSGIDINRANPSRNQDKVARVPVKFAPTSRKDQLAKPKWIKAKFSGTPKVLQLKSVLRENNLNTVCEEANCPNLGECFGNGTATFMIMGALCTRRCPFCDIAHGRPLPLDAAEPSALAQTANHMNLSYVVITSVDRDDLRDGGANHFAECIQALRTAIPGIRIEILVPDFRGRAENALRILAETPPDVFNHNLETVPRLYKKVRPGASYEHSLHLLNSFKCCSPDIPTKSGLMMGLGETIEEVLQVMEDMRANNVAILTLGQYLQPSVHHLPVHRYVAPKTFEELRIEGEKLGFTRVLSGPMVRSSYHADEQLEATNS